MVKRKTARATRNRTPESLDRSARGHILAKAAEHRVFSELLIKGHEVYLPIDDSGIDAVLENNIKINVKVCSRIIHHQKQSQNKKVYEYIREEYVFNAHLSKRYSELDFYIVWLPDLDVFYIIPAKETSSSNQQRVFPDNPDHKLSQYQNAWHLLD